MYREIKETDLVGKTIKSIDSSSVNVLKLEFEDGTSLSLWAEIVINLNTGGVPGFLVDD